MMYQHSVSSGVACSGNSPTSTPPNINACSSTTPPLSSGQQNASQNESNGNSEMVKFKLKNKFVAFSKSNINYLHSNNRAKQIIIISIIAKIYHPTQM